MAQENKAEVQRWTAKRKTALIVSIFKGETSVTEAAPCTEPGQESRTTGAWRGSNRLRLV